MKKIILSLVLIFGLLFGSMSFGEESDKNFLGILDGYNLIIKNSKIYFINDEGKLVINGKIQENTKNIEGFKVKNNGEKVFLIKENGKKVVQIGDKKGEYYDDILNLSLDNFGDVYYIVKKDKKYFIMKNFEKYSKDFFKIKYLVVIDNNIYFIYQNDYDYTYTLVKNGKEIFNAKDIYKLKINNVDKKLYFIFSQGKIHGIARNNEILVTNFLNNKYKYRIDNFTFSDNKKAFVYFIDKDYLSEKDNSFKGSFGKISQKEFEEKINFIKNNLEFYKDKKIENDLDLELFYSKRKEIYCYSEKCQKIKNIWKKFLDKNIKKINSKKLKKVEKKILEIFPKTKSKKVKQVLTSLYIIITNTLNSDDFWEDSLSEEEKEIFKNIDYLKNNEIGYDYEPRKYIDDAEPITIEKIEKKYDKKNNRFILTVKSKVDIKKGASAYYWWRSNNGYFQKIKGNEKFSKVYFYPEKVKPQNDYNIIVNGGDDLGFIDSFNYTIFKDEFNYSTKNNKNIESVLKILDKDEVMFEYNAFGIKLESYEKNGEKKLKPQKINIYIIGVGGKKLDKKITVYSKGSYEIDGFVGNHIFIPNFYSGKNGEWYGKKIELEIEAIFENGVKTLNTDVIYSPIFGIDGRIFIDDKKEYKFFINGKEIFLTYPIYPNGIDTTNNEINYSVDLEKTTKKILENKGNLEKFKIKINYSLFLDKYHSKVEDNIFLDFNTPKKYIIVQDTNYIYNEENKIKFINDLEKRFFNLVYKGDEIITEEPEIDKNGFYILPSIEEEKKYFKNKLEKLKELKKDYEDYFKKGGKYILLMQENYLEIIDKIKLLEDGLK